MDIRYNEQTNNFVGNYEALLNNNTLHMPQETKNILIDEIKALENGPPIENANAANQMFNNIFNTAFPDVDDKIKTDLITAMTTESSKIFEIFQGKNLNTAQSNAILPSLNNHLQKFMTDCATCTSINEFQTNMANLIDNVRDLVQDDINNVPVD